jgi:hypothetical protein
MLDIVEERRRRRRSAAAAKHPRKTSLTRHQVFLVQRSGAYELLAQLCTDPRGKYGQELVSVELQGFWLPPSR